jgi:glycosyltransferase involved in cell wall biosynthesis
MPDTDLPLVSIIIPTYNSSAYIIDAIESSLVQTYPNCEIIVVDDGSTDHTGDLLKARYGNRIRYIYQNNAGPGAARNRGIEAAQGTFIQFCDSDDQLLPTKIARCMEVFQRQPEVGVVYTDYRHVGADGQTPLSILTPPLLSGDIFCDLLLSNATAILTSVTLIRRAALLEVGLFEERRDLRCAEDWDLFLRLATRYHYASIDEELVLYRRHPNELTANAYDAALGRLIVIQKARHYARRERCLDDAAYDRLEADRHHVMAMTCWRMKQRGSARREFREAARLDPARNKVLWLNIIMTYGLPADSRRIVIYIYQRVRRLLGRVSTR